MIYDQPKKLIQLQPISLLDEFTLATVAGRDTIADQIRKDIDEYCQQAYDDGPRKHLGASIIGNSCERYSWFVFRWAKREIFSGRMQRLFQRGHLEEARIIEYLVGVGFKVVQVSEDGKQIRINGVSGHFGGSCDGNANLPERYGPVSQTTILVEFKTSNSKKFSPIRNTGVVKAKPQHWIQSCVYGFKLQIQYLLYICANKDDDDLAIELLEIDQELGKMHEEKAEKIINSYYSPPRLNNDPSHWECKYCPYNGVCHLNAPLDRNCRSCRYAQPVANGEWYCHVNSGIIPVDFIAKGCDTWKEIER